MRVVIGTVFLLSVACGDADTQAPDASLPDATPVHDASPPPDATPPDAVAPDAGPPDATRPDATADCAEALGHSDLAWIQDNIFTPSCSTFSACHNGAAENAAHLNLEAGLSEANLVNQASELVPTETRVVPGDAANSYLMVQLGSYPGPLGRFGTMPLGNPLLCIEKRDAIERWINSL